MNVHAGNRSHAMKVSVVTIGFGLVVVGRTILGFLRAGYLKQASESVSINPSQEIVLRHSIWDYVFAVLLFAGAVFMGWAAIHETNAVRLKMDIAFCLFCFVGGIFLSYLEWTGTVTIFNGKLIFTQGSDRWEVSANEVDRVTLTGFTFIVKKRSEKVVRIPATFEHSEIILAFLKQAAINK